MGLKEALDTFIRTEVMYETPTDKWKKSTKTKLKKLVSNWFPKDAYHTFFEFYVVEGKFRLLIGYRPLEDEEFHFVKCGTNMGN